MTDFIPTPTSGHINITNYLACYEMDLESLKLVDRISADGFGLELTTENLRGVIDQCLDEHRDYMVAWVNTYLQWAECDDADRLPLTATIKEAYDRYIAYSNQNYENEEAIPESDREDYEFFSESSEYMVAELYDESPIGSVDSFTTSPDLFWHLGD